MLFGRLEVNGAALSAVTSLQFSPFDPVGSLLAAFDSGVVKTWQSHEQLLKDVAQVDLCEAGYQQFDVVDNFDMFENPHGLEEVGEDERN